MLSKDRIRDALILLLSGIMQTSMAANNNKDSKDKSSSSYPYIITLSLGPSLVRGDETQTLFLQPDVQKTYTSNQKNDAIASGELFLGLQRQHNIHLQGQLGLAVMITSHANMSGDIWEDADPDFNNYIYTYKIKHTSVAVKGKILIDMNMRGMSLQPYINGSAGVGFNYADGFKITPKLFEEVPAPRFSANTETAFTYTLGVGLQKTINLHWQAGLGYEFADWGKSQLGRAPGQTLNSGLHLSHLYTNTMQLNLSYIA